RLLGIDLGTTSVKALLVGSSGELHGVGRSASPRHADGALVEQDPDEWWHGVVAAVRQALGDAGADAAIAGIAVAGQGPTTVAIDPTGRHLAPAITWLDTRASTIAAELSEATRVPVWQLGSLPHER